jgi:formamidopyrimidine-DNA glycosylase
MARALFLAPEGQVPELPDVEAYVVALRARLVGEQLVGIRLTNPFLLRTVDPPICSANGRTLVSVQRLGKRIVLGLEDDLFLVVHLMIAGRFHLKPPGAPVPRRNGLAAFDFPASTLLLTEAGKKRRASLHVVKGREALASLNPGGLEVLESTLGCFAEALRRENHTLKRSLTDPRILSGIGNAYSDEILHRAGLSPFKLTQDLIPEEMARLHAAAQAILSEWTNRLTGEAREAFPEKVTAFRPEMAVHGRYRQPCPTCGTPVQRIVYADNEMCYCPRCQTGGRVLADRALSRLLRDAWPRTIEELEEGPVNRVAGRPTPAGSPSGGAEFSGT